MDFSNFTQDDLISFNKITSISEKVCVHCKVTLLDSNWTVCKNKDDHFPKYKYKCDDCYEKLRYKPKYNYVPKVKIPKENKCCRCSVELTDENWANCLRGDRNKTGHYTRRCNDCSNSRTRNYKKSVRRQVITEYGSKCACCGLDNYDALEIDHINNDGYLERRTIKSMMNHIIRQGFPKDKYQILCSNCNRTKMMLKGQPCNCQDPSSSTISPQKFERPKKYLNVKFQPFETKKCTDCQVSLTDANYTPTSNGHSLKYVCKPCRSNRNAQYALQRRMKVLEAYGCKCNYCGYDKPLALEVDHIFNDGRQERKEKKIKDFYRFLIQNNYPKDRYQLLCANCNYIKQKGLKKAKRLKK